MKNAFKLFSILFLLFSKLLGQENVQLDDNDLINKVERYILEEKQDSAQYFLQKITIDTGYISILKKLATDKNPDYKALRDFIVSVTNTADVDYYKISRFINKNVKQPDVQDKINRDYTKIKTEQITQLRNDGDLDKSTVENEKLTKYINSFDQNERDVALASANASFHKAVMAFIQRDLEQVKEILDNAIAVAEKYNDTELKIGAQYYLSNVYVVEGKLQEYIEINEENLKLERESSSESAYYSATVINLLDAYIYIGGKDERVQELLNVLYNHPQSRKDSYALYAKYLGTLPTDSPYKRQIFEKFNVKNTKEFAELTVARTKDVLNSNDYYFVLIENSGALEKDNFLKEAIRFQEEAVEVNRKVYSQDLSKSLAAFQTEQAVKIKDIEIQNEKKRTRIYVIAAILGGLLLVVSLFFLLKTRQQSKKLKEKNKIIDEALKEKELLVKEIHHRVKNNFQIVSSLLELQSKGIEDKKAQQLANDGKNRVKSMALIHQRLYQNDSGLISFDSYIRELVKEISAMYQTESGVKTTIKADDAYFDVDTAIPLGLIINELITNAYKYAFAKADSPELNIILKQNQNDYSLTIKDNGGGMSPDFDFARAKSLGLRLVKRLTKQLQGYVIIESLEGTLFNISFKDTSQRKMVD
ncbi:sensor histidine kinase [Dokdonia sinensis]|uniref:histidine kinase n=1 Tax=Dokdonia sinensis TaxID=2479847 RepID=A0A3M0FTB8_9FLAO|nr:sensor histidine kinase [Dokdonia sinensis]RMB56050.1 sensor histidine kinase [Dokdonia sinensis]